MSFDAIAWAKLKNTVSLVGGKVPAEYLPSYIDEIISGKTFNDFPTTGQKDKIYVAEDTKKTYRWSPEAGCYIEISGKPAEDGATFTPNVDSDGNISWTNNKGLENPVTINIRGPKGEDGHAIQVQSVSDLPEVGDEKAVYFIIDKHMTYAYVKGTGYICTGMETAGSDISEIDGGDASSKF